MFYLMEPVSFEKNNAIIHELFLKYKDNEYAINRLEGYINNLNHLLEIDITNFEKRQLRTNELTNEYDTFCKVFLSKHKYYYLSNNNCFYEYDNKTYKIIKEDDIHYNLLSTITEEGKLLQWKHKTKINIIKLIKERKLFHSIPETYTIQSVLGFLQSLMFQSKNSVKYFLTVIGDTLLKKNNSYIYFIHPNVKKMVGFIDEIVYITTGFNLNNFVSKHHSSHISTNYRIIQTKEVDISTDVVKEMLHKIAIDLLCVAAHYSHRYQSSENYLERISKEDVSFYNHTLFFINHTQENIIDSFIKECFIQVVDTDTTSTSVSWKNLHYIWKLYISQLNVPNMIYSNQLKDFVKTRLDYNTEQDSFIHVTSKYLPQISVFLHFWEKYIVIDATNSLHNYEIEEISSLFKSIDNKTTFSSDKEMLKIIKHFFDTQVQIIDDKFITNIRCILWDKIEDIKTAIYDLKISLVSETEQLISFDDLYNKYHAYCNANMYVNKSSAFIVSKHYFEKYVFQHLSEFIKFDSFLDLKLFLEQ